MDNISWGLFLYSMGLFIAGRIYQAVSSRYSGTTPYHWTCPVCKKKNQKTKLKASDREILDRLRIAHMNTTHLRNH